MKSGPRSRSAQARGRFIVIEGAEAAGKSTQTRRLVEFLRSSKVDVVLTREPGGTAVGEQVRDVLLSNGTGAIPRETELFLILAARAALVREVVEPALADGRWVVSDRFDLSSLAYQGYGREMDLERVRELNEVATGGLVPDLYLVLDLPPGAGVARHERAGKAMDRFESEGDAFLEAVRRGYVELAEGMDRAVLVSGDGGRSAVEARLRCELLARFPEIGCDRSGARARSGVDGRGWMDTLSA